MSNIPTTRLQAFSVFDKVAKAFMPPFFIPNIGMAIRAFGDDVTRSNSHISKHPADFDLYHVGAFDDNDGTLYSFAPSDRKVISRALDFASYHSQDDSIHLPVA